MLLIMVMASECNCLKFILTTKSLVTIVYGWYGTSKGSSTVCSPTLLCFSQENFLHINYVSETCRSSQFKSANTDYIPMELGSEM